MTLSSQRKVSSGKHQGMQWTTVVDDIMILNLIISFMQLFLQTASLRAGGMTPRDSLVKAHLGVR
jgi:hypothetical protein